MEKNDLRRKVIATVLTTIVLCAALGVAVWLLLTSGVFTGTVKWLMLGCCALLAIAIVGFLHSKVAEIRALRLCVRDTSPVKPGKGVVPEAASSQPEHTEPENAAEKEAPAVQPKPEKPARSARPARAESAQRRKATRTEAAAAQPAVPVSAPAPAPQPAAAPAPAPAPVQETAEPE